MIKLTGNCCPFAVHEQDFLVQFTDNKINGFEPEKHFHTHHAEKNHNIFTY